MFTGKCDMKKIKALIILLSILMFIGITACSSSKNADVTDVPALTHFEPITDIAEGRRNIYLIVKIVDSGYWQVIINGARDAGNACGVNVYCGGTSMETDWAGQRILIDEALDAKADAIILSPDDSVELAPDIEKIHDMGIPIVLIDTAANTNSFDICYMTDNLLAGQNAAREMLYQLHNTGHAEDTELNVGIMVGQSTSQTINERLAGFFQYWSNNAPGKWTISTDIMNCNGNIDLGGELTRNFLKKNPATAGLYATNNGPTRAICQTISDSARTDIVVVGFDFSDEMKALIESPDYCASTMLQRQYDMSYRGVMTSLDILNRKKPDIKFVDTGIVTVNSETINDPDVEKVLEHN